MLEELKGYRPTIGFCALKAVLDLNFSELYISGFTFFKTTYAEGYRDKIRQVVEVQKHINDQNLHNPDLELEYFLRLLVQNQGKKILMDDTLQSIVEQSLN
jgi:hypothetical protein